MIQVPRRIRDLTPYVAGKTIAEVKKTHGIDKISKLASNENRLGCSPRVKPAVERALKQIQDYPDPEARKLRAEIASKNHVNESEIIIAAGSESILSILCRSLLGTSDNVLTADATFVGIYVQAGVVGAQIKKVKITDEYGFDTEAMLEAIDSNTKMIYIANPNNPTGTYIGKSEYTSFIEQVPDHILIVADEAYFEYAKDIDDYPHALDYRKDNVVVTRTFSKGYGLAGFRIGYAITNADLTAQLMKSKLTFEPTTLAQAAALAALRDESFLSNSVALVERERRRIYDFFDDYNVEYVPSISNSVMINLGSEEKAIHFTQRMLENGVILRRLNAFGLPHCVRITMGTENEMDHFIDSFKGIQNI